MYFKVFIKLLLHGKKSWFTYTLTDNKNQQYVLYFASNEANYDAAKVEQIKAFLSSINGFNPTAIVNRIKNFNQKNEDVLVFLLKNIPNADFMIDTNFIENYVVSLCMASTKKLNMVKEIISE